MVNGLLSLAFSGLKGETGATGATGATGPAGVTSAVASVDGSSGTPSVAVTLSNGQLSFAFSGIKGVPGTSIVLSTSIVSDKNDNTKAATPKAVYEEVHPAVQSSQPAGGFAPNVLYALGTITGTVSFALASPADNTINNHYFWTFDTGSTAPNVTFPASITKWFGEGLKEENGVKMPDIKENKHYEVSVLDGVGALSEC